MFLKLDNLLNKIIYSSLSDEDFYENFGLILAICCVICKRNIKLVFGNGTAGKTPYFSITENFKLDILLGWDCNIMEFRLLYILENFSFIKQ